ncbi:uncharacterized protein LOC131246879 isoform X2 [Magnolia sinica]|uniref:uncharacterized protein LOC131246879 isoform X2 n=1 Tax=Magnolia sinica TaxID=86752 RepID=UPI00265B4074|nr:uncharacterized protein LOC131246879 isoform X2 [Magnolia sinica]
MNLRPNEQSSPLVFQPVIIGSRRATDESLWGHPPLLVRSNSKESVEYIPQALWRTRNTGLDSADRDIIRDMLQLPTDSDLDLMRRCVCENFSKDEIHKLFPQEVSPELQRLLTLLLQKFQREWRDDALKDQVSLPRLKAMTWNMANQDAESTDHVAVINLKLQDDTQSLSGETEVKFQLAKDTMETMLRSLHYIRNQLSNTGLDLLNCLLFKPGHICSVACWMRSWGLAHGTNLVIHQTDICKDQKQVERCMLR